MAIAYLHYLVNMQDGRITEVAVHSEELPVRVPGFVFAAPSWYFRTATADTFAEARSNLLAHLRDHWIGWPEGSPVAIALRALGETGERQIVRWAEEDKPVARSWVADGCRVDEHPGETHEVSFGEVSAKWTSPPSWTVTALEPVMPIESVPLYSARQAMIEAGVPNAEMGGGVSTADAIRCLAAQRDAALAEVQRLQETVTAAEEFVRMIHQAVAQGDA